MTASAVREVGLKIVAWLLAGPLFLLGIALLLLWVPLPAPVPPPFSHGRNLPAALAVGLLGLAYAAATPFVAVHFFRAPGRRLDAAFVPLGLAPRSYLLWGRAFGGAYRGRRVEVRFVPGVGVRRARIEASVEASPPARLAVGRRRPLLDGLCARTLPGALPEPWVVTCAEEGPAGALLGLGGLSRRLTAVLEFRGVPCEVYLRPGGLLVRGYPGPVGAEDLRAWLDALLDLALASDGSGADQG